MNYTQSIELDLSCGAPPVIQAKQGDDGARIVKITLLSNGVAYAPPAGATARFRALKPDGYSVDNPAALSAGVVTVELTAQTLAVPGTVKADVVLTDSDGDILSTGTFHIIVEPAPVGKNIASSNEFITLQELIKKAEGLESGAGLISAEGVGF